jgi:hypothetical protein
MDVAQRDQALERRPSSAWARKMLPLIRAKTIVTVSIIAVVRRRPRIEQNDVSPRTVKTISRRAENRNLTDDLEQQYPLILGAAVSPCSQSVANEKRPPA